MQNFPIFGVVYRNAVYSQSQKTDLNAFMDVCITVLMNECRQNQPVACERENIDDSYK